MQFIPLKNDKSPNVIAISPEYYQTTFDNLENAGLILGEDIIVLDFDNDNISENIICDYIDANYPTLCVKTKRGKHFYYKMPSEYHFKKNSDVISVLGFQCDYLTGKNAYAVIKLDGKTRKMNKELTFDNLPELPLPLYPLYKAKDNLTGMLNGDGRNNNLYKHLLLVKETYPEININEVANIINNVIFEDKLKKRELNNIIKSAIKKETNKIKNKDKINNIQYATAKSLQDKDLPPITFYVDGLIPQGLTLICSLPKIGKSWMALDLCLSISRGMPFLGFKTLKTGCLYLALEDSEHRLKNRLNKVLNGDTAPDNFIYATRCDDIENGLINEIKNIIKKEPYIKVIVIDTLQKIRSDYNGKNNYANDYKEVGTIKDFADDNGLAIILIHHLKKGNDSDIFGKVSGTNGITGTADTTIVLDRQNRYDKETILSITGRDVEQNQYILNFNKESCKWQMISSYEEKIIKDELEEYNNNPLVDTIKTLVNENNGKWAGSLKELGMEQQKLYSNLIDSKVKNSMIDPIKPLLKKYDDIGYYTTANPVKNNLTGKSERQKVFYKMPIKKDVENVESVDNVENT